MGTDIYRAKYHEIVNTYGDVYLVSPGDILSHWSWCLSLQVEEAVGHEVEE